MYSYILDFKIKIIILFSHQNNKKNKITFPDIDIHSNQIENITEKKDISIELFELFINRYKEKFTLEIMIDNKEFILNVDKVTKKTNFLFDQKIIDKNTKEEKRLNCLNINEEFDIYYNYFKDKNDLESLIKSTLALLDEEKYSSFSFLFHIFSKCHHYISKLGINNILLKIKYKGNLSKYDNQNLYKSIPEEFHFSPILIIYYIFNDIFKLKKFIDINENNIITTINFLYKYSNLFDKALEIFPAYSFLIDKAETIEKIKIVLKCSNNFSNFIYMINEKKEHISKYITDKLIIINDFFDLNNIFNEPFNNNFYKSLIELNEYEIKSKTKILDYFPEKLENLKDIQLIRRIIYDYFKGEKKKQLSKQLYSLINKIDFKIIC